MASFFEKLKKGMGIEEGAEGKIKDMAEEPAEEKITKKPAKKIRVKKTARENKPFVIQTKNFEVKALKIEKEPEMETKEIKEKVERKEKPSPTKLPIETQIPPEETEEKFSFTASGTVKDKEKWPGLGGEPEGQLAIDVYQTENDLVIQSAIAGVKPEILDISMEKDVINIKGSRQRPFEENGDYFSQECFWGPFSREIILPADVDPNRAEATMKDGILTIRIPKILREKKRKIVVRG
jgi:HSP20 family protein